MDARSPQIERFLEPAQSCMCFGLRKTARVITQHYDHILRPLGLKATQFSLLVGIRLFGTTTVNRLAEAMVMDRTTLTRNLRPLEKQGLIRTIKGTDRRQREITLSAAGQAILTQALSLWRKAQQQLKKELGNDRFARLLIDLDATVRAVQAG